MPGFFRRLFRPGPKRPEASPSPTPVETGLPYECVAVPGPYAIRVRKDLAVPGKFHPVIHGERKALNLLEECHEIHEQSADEILEVAERIEIPGWFREREAEEPESFQVAPAEWPEAPPGRFGLTAHLDPVTRTPHETVIIGLLPVDVSWKVPAHIKNGGWNECPGPEEHVAVFRSWHERYGAEVACFTNDVVEFLVPRPPRTREDAMALAREQFVYCPDIVLQGVESLEVLAATLLDGPTWYFWWD